MTYFYLYLFLIFAFFSFSEIIGTDGKLLNVYKKIAVFIIIFVAGFRYETGVDWAGYQYTYDITPALIHLKKDNFSDVFLTLDLGYSLLNSMIKSFDGGIQTIFIVVSILSTTLLYKNLKFYTQYILTGFLVYYCYFFFVFDMSGLRQGLALQILLYSYRFLIDKKIKKFFLYVLIAGSIHWTAYVFVLFYFSLQKDWRKISPYLILISLVFFTIKFKFLQNILEQINTNIKMYTLVSGKISAYTTNDKFSQAREWNLFSIYNCIRILGIYFLYRFYNFKGNKYFLFFNLLILEFIFFFMLAELREISERFRFYFAITEIILIGYIFEREKVNFKRHILMLFVIFISFVNSYPFFLNAPGTIAYQPYQNYIYYKLYDIKSTGVIRLNKHSDFHEN